MSNLYEALGVSETASQEEIKKTYRKLSLQYHPDRNNNSSESTVKIQSINSAYEILGDEEKRKQYDMQTKMQSMPFHVPFGQGMPFHMPGGATFFTTSHNVNDGGGGGGGGGNMPADILNFFASNFFGGGGNGGGGGITIDGNGIKVGGNMFTMENMKQRLAKPTPIIKTETISLNKAFTGYNMPVEITRWIVENDLKREETEMIYIPIPRGVDNNEIIILRDKGNVLAENNKGDIKVFIKIQNDTEFVRNGLDLILNKTIGIKDALCGFSFDMNYLDGRIFKINNTVGNIITNNTNKVLNGMGMKRDEHTGNLIINFNVVFPEQLTTEQIEALQAIL
jgi:DnaJ family protein B protein 4